MLQKGHSLGGWKSAGLLGLCQICKPGGAKKTQGRRAVGKIVRSFEGGECRESWPGKCKK